MGGSSSSAITQDITQNIVTKSTLNAFNEQINKNIANVVMKNAQNSGGNITQLSSTNVGIMVARGHSDINFTNNDSQNAKLTFQAIQSSLQKLDLKQVMSNQIAEQLKNSTSASTFNKLIGHAQASMKSGIGSFMDGSSHVSATVNANIKTNINTDQETTLKNITNLLVQTNANTDAIKNCFSNVFQNQQTNYAGIFASDYATVDITNQVSQIAQSVATCKQLTTQTNSVTSQLASVLGLKIVQTSKVELKNDISSTTKSKNVEGGIGAMIAGILGAFTGPFKIICIVFLIGCMGCSLFIFMSKKKHNDGGNDSVNTPPPDTSSNQGGDPEDNSDNQGDKIN